MPIKEIIPILFLVSAISYPGFLGI